LSATPNGKHHQARHCPETPLGQCRWPK